MTSSLLPACRKRRTDAPRQPSLRTDIKPRDISPSPPKDIKEAIKEAHLQATSQDLSTRAVPSKTSR
jgi:hypothetical protein